MSKGDEPYIKSPFVGWLVLFIGVLAVFAIAALISPG